MGVGSLRGGLSQEGTSVVFVVPLAAWSGRPGFPFSASQAGGPLGGLIIGLGARVESFKAPVAKQSGSAWASRRIRRLAGPGAQACTQFLHVAWVGVCSLAPP